jgi:hypothetical protein
LKTHYKNILMAFISDNTDLRKIKISGTNLNDDKIVELLCNIIQSDVNLISVDFSWGSLSSKHMYMIAKSINESTNPIMNLNLAYNSLSFIEPVND